MATVTVGDKSLVPRGVVVVDWVIVKGTFKTNVASLALSGRSCGSTVLAVVASLTGNAVIDACTVSAERRKEMFYLTMHSTHFIYGYMASDIWLRTILIVREETCCRHIGYSF